jgi:CHASE3 domain sensor protein
VSDTPELSEGGAALTKYNKVSMRSKLQIGAIALLVLLTALEVMALRFYRQGRRQNQALTAARMNPVDAKINSSLSNGADALLNLQLNGTNYVLTGRADLLKAYRENLEDWRYEAQSLNLVTADESKAARLREFSQTGNHLANEIAAIVSLYDSGAKDAAFSRLRTGATITDWSEIKAKEAANRQVFDGASSNRPAVHRINDARRLVYCAGALYALAVLGIALFLYSSRMPGNAIPLGP